MPSNHFVTRRFLTRSPSCALAGCAPPPPCLPRLPRLGSRQRGHGCAHPKYPRRPATLAARRLPRLRQSLCGPRPLGCLAAPRWTFTRRLPPTACRSRGPPCRPPRRAPRASPSCRPRATRPRKAGNVGRARITSGAGRTRRWPDGSRRQPGQAVSLRARVASTTAGHSRQPASACRRWPRMCSCRTRSRDASFRRPRSSCTSPLLGGKVVRHPSRTCR